MSKIARFRRCHASYLNNTSGKKFSAKNIKDLVMASVTFGIIPPLEKAKKQGEMPLTRLSPIPL